jgi:hypothetical protein
MGGDHAPRQEQGEEMSGERPKLTLDHAARLTAAVYRGRVSLCVVSSAEEEASAKTNGWSDDYEALPKPLDTGGIRICDFLGPGTPLGDLLIWGTQPKEKGAVN